MAQKLAAFTNPRSGHNKYPWDEWTDGSVWQVIRGEDFDCTPASFRSALTNAARARGMACSARLVDDKTLEFQFRPQS